MTGRTVRWVRQVHGERVVVVGSDDGHQGARADALVTTEEGLALAVFTADCGSVALVGDQGVLGAVHAGWRGVASGVLERTVEVMRGLGAGDIAAGTGPCIGPECYEFDGAQLAEVARRLGDGVRGTTSWGTPALDLRAATRAALQRVDVEVVYAQRDCTACSPHRYFSHRARGEEERQAMFVWRG